MIEPDVPQFAYVYFTVYNTMFAESKFMANDDIGASTLLAFYLENIGKEKHG